MASLNRVFLAGNLTRDPEVRYTPSGAAVATLGLAVNRFFTTKSGEKKEETLFIRVVVWGKLAESCKDYLKKGSPILAEGRLVSRSWEQNGQKRNTIEVVALNIQFLEKTGRGQADKAAPEIEEVPEEAMPYDDSVKKAPVSGTEDDIPF